MAFRSKTATETFFLPEWVDPKTGKPQSGWTFRKYKLGEDDDWITRELADRNAHISKAEQEKARRMGRKYQPEVTVKVNVTQVKLTMLRMSVEWFGPEFTVPKDFPDPKTGKKSEYAGRVPPITLDWINLQDAPILDAVETFLDKLYEERSAEAEAEFPEGDPDLGESEAE